MRAWDLPTRLFHWLLAILVLLAWASWRYSEALGDPTLAFHRWNGHAILVLVVFRLLWGLFGSSTSRFSAWLWWPWTAAAYALRLLRGETPLYPPPQSARLLHDPGTARAPWPCRRCAGSSRSSTTTSRPARSIGSSARRRASSSRSWHRWWFYWVILALVPIHIVANLWYGIAKKEPLIRAMVTGTKPAAPYLDAPEAVIVARPALRAVACLLAAAAIVFGTIFALGGKML